MKLRLGIVQPTTGIDPLAEALSLTGAIAELAAKGVQIIFTPEMSGLLDRDRRRAAANVSFEADDPVLAAVCDAARAHGVWVQLGSLALKTEGDLLANRGFLIDNQGQVRARYDKIHLFDVQLPGGETYRESAAYRPGEAAVVAKAERYSLPATSSTSCTAIRPAPATKEKSVLFIASLQEIE
jgi:predicted amidohydrolase